MSTRLFTIFSALSLLALASCSQSTSTDKPILAVSIDPQKAILEQLAGDNFEVVTILAKGANPESFEPSVAQRMQTDQAKAYFTTGYLPFEQALAKSMDKDKVVNTSVGIVPILGTHNCQSHSHSQGHSHSHSDSDPHVWTSLRNGKIIATNMAAALAEIDPDNAAVYAQRLDALCTQIDSLDAQVAQQLAESGAHAFAVWHPSLSYFARDYGLHQIAVGQESKEISIGTLRSIIEEAKADSVRVFFFQKEYDSRQAENLNNEIGARMVTINPLAYDWINELTNIANELTR